MSIAAPATNPASDLELKLPSTVGSAGQVLSVDGSGNLVWTDNTPMWLVKLKTTGTQTVPNTTWTTLELQNEIFDTDNGFNTSNYTYTVPAGKGGKYWLYYQARVNDNPDDTESVQTRIDKNGNGGIHISYKQSFSIAGNSSTWIDHCWVEALTAGDVLKFELYHNEGGNVDVDDLATFFGGYRLIGG